MNVLLRYRTCEITFDETDPFYAGKTVELQGESPDEATFYVPKSERLYWTVSSPENSSRHIGVSVNDSEKEALLSYIIEKAKEVGYNIVLW